MPSTAVVPTWQRRDLLVSLLSNLARQTVPFASILVVDNGSTDGSAEAARAHGAQVLRFEQNLGFAKAVNRGIAAAGRTPWIAILNNDILLEPDWLERMTEAAAVEQDSWFFNGKLLRFEDRAMLDGTFDLICRGGIAWRAGHGRPDGPVWNQSREIGFPSFTAGLFRRDLFDQVGMLDESFGSYYEDVDFGLRCALIGLTGRYIPSARGTHRGSATLGAWRPDTVRWLARNQKLLSCKHFPHGSPIARQLWGALAARRGRFAAWFAGMRAGTRECANTRLTASNIHPRMEEILCASERELYELQQATGFDSFWKWYFRLAGKPR